MSELPTLLVDEDIPRFQNIGWTQTLLEYFNEIAVRNKDLFSVQIADQALHK